MEIKDWQKKVDDWIKTYGVRYFDVKTNTLLLSEELGEVSRLIARRYGEQSFKKETDMNDVDDRIAEELGDMLFVLTCICNQLSIDLEQVVEKNLRKKTSRDASRHQHLKNVDEL